MPSARHPARPIAVGDSQGRPPMDLGVESDQDVPVPNQPALCRDTSRRVISGVCAGLARTVNVDPILIRAALIVASVASMGMTVLAYLVFWVLMPSDAGGGARRWTPARTFGVLLAVIVILGLFLPDRTTTIGLLILLGVALTWYIVRRLDRRQQGRSAPSPQQWQQPPHAGLPPRPGQGVPPQLGYVSAAYAYGAPPGPWPPAAPAPRSRRSGGMRLALGGIAASWVVLGVLGVFRVPYGPIAFPASALAAAGLALVAVSRPGASVIATKRPRGVIAIGLVAALVTVSMLLSERPPTPAASATQRYTGAAALPRTLELGMGTHTVDLSDLHLDEDAALTVTADVGALTVILPADANVNATYAVDMGSLTGDSGLSKQNGMDISERQSLVRDPSAATLTLQVQLDVGQLVVRG